MTQYPSRYGLPVPVTEIELPSTRLRDVDHNKNNHHLLFPRKRYELGGIIYATLRDLDSMQQLLPRDVHNVGKPNLHTIYSPPSIPKPITAIDYICEANARGEKLKVGSMGVFEYRELDDGLMQAILKEAANLTQLRGAVA